MKAEQDLQKLQELLKNLSSAEIDVIKKLIEQSKSNLLKVNKQEKLFFLLLNKDKIEYDKVKKLISKDTTDYGFIRLIGRLKNRVIESLYLDVNLNRSTSINSAFRHKLMQKKLLVSAFVLHSRGMIDLSMDIYNEVIIKSKRFELYDDLLEALYIKQGLVGLSKGMDAYNKLAEQIIFYEECRIAFYNAKNWYRSFYARVDFEGLKSLDFKADLKKYISLLNSSYEFTRSANVKMYKFLFEMELFQQLSDFVKVDEVGREFVKFIRKSRAIFGKERVGTIYSQLAENKIKSFEFKESLEYSKTGIEFFLNKNLNYFVAKELEVEAAYYEGDIFHLESLIKDLSKDPFYEGFDYRRTKLRFYLGMVYFLQHNFKQAKLEFNDTKEIEKDKAGWNVWVRIMRILCNVSLAKYNFIEYDIESFRRYVKRTQYRNDVRSRDELILTSLLTLERNGFDFAKTYKEEKKLFEKLESMDDLYRWRVDSPELIIYHQWFVSKIDNTAYKPNFEPYKQHAKIRVSELKNQIRKQEDE